MKTILLLAALAVSFISCSVTKKIGRVAEKDIFSNKHFANAHTGIAIFDAQKGRMLYGYQSEKYFVPASNTKLASCYAAMKYLGDSLPGVQYQVLNDTTVLIAGTGDPTVLHPDFSNQPVFYLLKQFKEIRLFNSGFDDYLGNGWAWNDYTEDYMAPRSSLPLYGNVVHFTFQEGKVNCEPAFFKKDLEIKSAPGEGIYVYRPWQDNNFIITNGRSKQLDVPFVPADSTLRNLLADTLHEVVVSDKNFPEGTKFVYTQPLDSMLSVMMHRSDNFFAEQCLMMVSQKLTGGMNDRRIIRKILDTDFGNLPQPPGWVDGSGLSRYNLFSPRDFVYILQKMNDEFGLERMKAILPTGGTGTLSQLYKNEKGFIFAKTGTLNGVVALSGYLITAKNKLLLFSVLVNNHRSNASDIRKGIEQFLIDIRKKY